MTYSAIKKSVSGLLRGDNSKADETLSLDDTFISMAIRDISMRCIPLSLLEEWDETKTDVFRRIYSTLDEEKEVYSHFYIRIPTVSIDDDAEVEMDAELISALIYFMCSYLSNKKRADYVQSAEETISFFDSNSVDLKQYEY